LQFERIIDSRGAVVARRLPFSSLVLREIMMAVDSLVLLSVAYISFYLVVGSHTGASTYYLSAVAFVWLVSISLMNFAALYQLDPAIRPLAFTDKFIIAFATTFLFLLAAAFALKLSESFSRIWMVAFAISACVATIVVRYGAARCLKTLAARQIFTRRVVIVGNTDQAQRLLQHFDSMPPAFISILGVFTLDNPATQIKVRPLLGSFDLLPNFVWSSGVNDVIIALPWSQDEKILDVLSKLRELPVSVHLASDLIGFRLPLRPSPDHYRDVPVVEVMGPPFPGWGRVKKRLMDWVLTIAILPIVVPLMALVAIAIKIEDGGPVFFRQARHGFGHETFWIWKFRTMRPRRLDETTTQQAIPGDHRVTRVGRILRQMSLDELPQLFNVLAGSMSLVGPRPHAVDHNEEYARLIRGYFARHRVKPGITGWAQVNGLRGATIQVEQMEARVKHDIYYTENWSMLFDLKILLMTFAVCLSGRNAY